MTITLFVMTVCVGVCFLHENGDKGQSTQLIIERGIWRLLSLCPILLMREGFLLKASGLFLSEALSGFPYCLYYPY